MPNRSDKNRPSKNVATPDQPVVDWYAEYVNSPKYRERLSGFYQYPDYIQRKRNELLSGLKITENTGTASRYWENDNEVRVSPLQIQQLNTTRPEVVAHEVGHVMSGNTKNKAATLNPAEEKFILERNKNVSKESLERFTNMAKERGASLSDILSRELHDVNPGENLSDVQSLRFLLKQRNIYDAGKQDVTPEVIRKAASDPVIRRSFIWKRLKEAFGEKELTEVMNKVASSKSSKKQNIA